MRRYLHRAPDAVEPLYWDFACMAMASVARWCIIPLQDWLGLDNRARINHPSTLGGNWRWRVTADALTSRLAARIRTVTETYGRCPGLTIFRSPLMQSPGFSRQRRRLPWN